MTARDRYILRCRSARPGRRVGVGRAPAGYFALDIRYGHLVVAGAVAVCLNCGCEEKLPIPRLAPVAYSKACEDLIERHKNCGVRS